MIQKSSFEIEKFEFDNDLAMKLNGNNYANDLWPLVYILSDKQIKEAYVGETTDALSRMAAHLKHGEKSKLSSVHIITSEKFNKSAALDIESNLIKYIAGDGQYKLLNGNLGISNHTYYQKKEIYWDIFKSIWEKLKSEDLVKSTLSHINNSDLFKYSPYKTLSSEQKSSIVDIVKALLSEDIESIIVEGGAGTGKTILAVFLFKLLNSDKSDFNLKEFSSDEEEFAVLVDELRNRYSNPSMALVIPMSSFRDTLKKVFKNIKGLKSNMVIGPSEVANRKFDILIVDESHRLRKRVNLGAYFGAFDKSNEKLNLDKAKGTELDWVVMQGKKKIFFYDANQSIKPSDVKKEDFDALSKNKSTLMQALKSQFRVRGGNDYILYVDKLLNCKLTKKDAVYDSNKYEFLIFSSLGEMVDKIKEKDREIGLARLVAGYSWKWVSNTADVYDIVIDNVQLKWNSVSSDWVNSENAVNEVGCIHTTQGYDLNYTGVIFGNEISYDPENNRIVIKEDRYFDKNGKQSIRDPEDLKKYIINIYKTIMLRGIKGTYIYACDDNLREYLSRHIKIFENKSSLKMVSADKVVSFDNAVPVYDLKIAAGNFSDYQVAGDFSWVELPAHIPIGEGYFVAQVLGESMNKRIPSGSWCLFKPNPGGSRNLNIVLVQHRDIQDAEMGGHYTVKQYISEKSDTDDGSWEHAKIILRPKTTAIGYKDIILKPEQIEDLKVIGEFIDIIG